MNTLTFDSGAVIFRQGDVGWSMYDIVNGKVGIYSAYGTDDEKLIAVLDNAQILGEMGMLEYYPRSATAVALEDGTVLCEITEDELSSYFRGKPEKLLVIMKQLASRIRETNDKLVDTCRVVYESQQAKKSGLGQSDLLKMQIEAICAASEMMRMH